MEKVFTSYETLSSAQKSNFPTTLYHISQLDMALQKKKPKLIRAHVGESKTPSSTLIG